MTTLKEDHDSWAAGGIIRRDFRHSHDGPEEMPHRRKRSRKGKRYKGCPERNHGAHIYVWVEYRGKRYRWYEGENRYVDSIWWEKICVGCGHRSTSRFPWYTWNNENEPYDIYEVRKVEHDWLY